MKMSIYEMNEKYGASIRTLKRMEKDGVFGDGVRIKPNREIDKICYRLKKDQQLTVENLVHLAKGMIDFSKLDPYSAKAKKQVKALGDIGATAFPEADIWLIANASLKKDEAVKSFAEWIAKTIPDGGCGYHYIAVRALWNCPDTQFKFNYARIARAIVAARKSEILIGRATNTANHMTFSAKKCLTFDL